jgi:hypothetical protein
MLTPNSSRHYLSVSTSYKQDPWNLIEWLEYHIIVGVNHFYIYNNDHNARFSNHILKPYVEEGYVTVVKSANLFRGNRQAAAHNHALNLARTKTIWLAMLDIDEFIYPLVDDKIMLAKYDLYGQVMLNYACFGSSGHIIRPNLQTQAYLRRAKDGWEWNELCKAIGQVQKVQSVKHHHHFVTGKGKTVDEDGKVCGWVKKYKGKYLRINHYMARSIEDYKVKMSRGNPLGEKRDWKWFKWADRNEIYDDGLWNRFGNKILTAIEKRRKLFNYSKGKVLIM